MENSRSKSTRNHLQANAKALQKANMSREVRIPFGRNNLNPISRPRTSRTIQLPKTTIPDIPIKFGISEIGVPDWFKKKGPIDVSVIIPLFRSSDVLFDLANSWKFNELDHEIIFVNDACPQSSFRSAIPAFMGKSDNGIGRVVSLSINSGFATACNKGAEIAKGKYLIFLNADTIVTENWMKNIIYPLVNEEIGIVGNLQLKQNGIIDSAGSEWMKQTRHFEHIGRNVFNGERLDKSSTVQTAPSGMLESGIRQMVTGCCISLRKDFFEKIGCFDEGYKIGYWEDADLCMKVWSNNKKVYFESKSIIYHKGSHSGASGHKHMKENAKLFYKKWTGENLVPYPIQEMVK